MPGSSLDCFEAFAFEDRWPRSDAFQLFLHHRSQLLKGRPDFVLFDFDGIDQSRAIQVLELLIVPANEIMVAPGEIGLVFLDLEVEFFFERVFLCIYKEQCELDDFEGGWIADKEEEGMFAE